MIQLVIVPHQVSELTDARRQFQCFKANIVEFQVPNARPTRAGSAINNSSPRCAPLETVRLSALVLCPLAVFGVVAMGKPDKDKDKEVGITSAGSILGFERDNFIAALCIVLWCVAPARFRSSLSLCI